MIMQNELAVNLGSARGRSILMRKTPRRSKPSLAIATFYAQPPALFQSYKYAALTNVSA